MFNKSLRGVIIKLIRLFSILLLTLLSGCSGNLIGNYFLSVGLLIAGITLFILVFFICVKIGNLFDETGKKRWEMICMIGFVIFIISLASITDGGQDMEALWFGRR